MKRMQCLWLAILSLVATTVVADDIDGTWKFEKAIDHEGLLQNVDPPPEYRTIQIVNAQLGLPPECFVSLEKMVDRLDVPFQVMFRAADLNTKQIGEYLDKKFGFKLTDVSYRADPHMSDCNKLGLDILVSKDRIIVIKAGLIFLSYKRSDGGTSTASRSTVPLYGHKLSQLPYNQKNFMNLCADHYPRGKKGPLTTTKCAPVYYPYAVYAKDKDPLSALIGTHKYLAGGSQTNNAEDYDDPLSNGLHPVFMLLPPLGDVLLVRVEDMQGGEVRDGIGGVFLSIKNGRVVDQLNDDCNWNERYYCGYDDGKPRYQLLESGKFKELK
jgi:hypothetical protein